MPYFQDASLGSGFLDFPSKIQIQTTNRCNYLCPMCPYPEEAGGKEGRRLDIALYKRLIDEVRAAGRKVKLCLMLQNEPFLDKRFLELLDYAHRAEDAITSVSTVTNGSVLDDALLDQLLAYPRFLLTISVNATDRERYERIHGRDFWERVHGLLSRWQGQRGRVRLSFVLDANSLQEGRAFQDYWRGLGYSTRFVPINSRVDQMTQNARVHELDEAYGHCHYPVDTLTVLVDGGVILCCNDWKHDLRFGNLGQSSIAEVWNGPRFSAMRQAAVKGTLRDYAICKACDYPVRSGRRLELEALLSEQAPLVGAGDRPVVSHQASVRLRREGPSVPALVWSADEATGSAVVFVPKALREQVPADLWLELRIGHSGAFNFGSLEPVWCPGRATLADAELEMEDAVPLRIGLARDSEEFQFFRWYCADWSAS